MDTSLAALKPTRRSTVMALLAEARVEVGHWADRPDQNKPAASNPKYCYQWAFIEPGVCAVLNFWHEEMTEEQGEIVRRLNMYQAAEQIKSTKGKTARYRRALECDAIVREAYLAGLPVRVIVCGRGTSKTGEPTTRVGKRELDPVGWAVTEYNEQTREFLVVRGAMASRYVDQFDVVSQEDTPGLPTQKQVTTQAFVRDPAVRSKALNRAAGKCEYCGVDGFLMPDGRRYLETHHVDPLSEGGPDTLENVAAVCANCHRKAHYGIDRLAIRRELLERIQAK